MRILPVIISWQLGWEASSVQWLSFQVNKEEIIYSSFRPSFFSQKNKPCCEWPFSFRCKQQNFTLRSWLSWKRACILKTQSPALFFCPAVNIITASATVYKWVAVTLQCTCTILTDVPRELMGVLQGCLRTDCQVVNIGLWRILFMLRYKIFFIYTICQATTLFVLGSHGWMDGS